MRCQKSKTMSNYNRGSFPVSTAICRFPTCTINFTTYRTNSCSQYYPLEIVLSSKLQSKKHSRYSLSTQVHEFSHTQYLAQHTRKHFKSSNQITPHDQVLNPISNSLTSPGGSYIIVSFTRPQDLVIHTLLRLTSPYLTHWSLNGLQLTHELPLALDSLSTC